MCEELADDAIYLLGLAQMLDADLDAEITGKIAINQRVPGIHRESSPNSVTAEPLPSA
jgi:NTP pyrophosphatase (non-canonical NTP hydrolase)